MIEKGKETGSVETSLEDLMWASKCFGGMAAFAVREKEGVLEIIDESYFFDPKAKITIKDKGICSENVFFER